MSRKLGKILGVEALPEDAQERLAEWAIDERLALEAAIVITRYRKRHGEAPTFAELFDALAQKKPHARLEWQLDSRVTFAFRHHIAVHWRRLGWIKWGPQARSLRTGSRFRMASRAHTRSLAATQAICTSGTYSSQVAEGGLEGPPDPESKA